ncbi:protein translocase subunit SecD [Patescibacteria group bacterium]|nr:protein translocase subunit SecD [Patescibacteria group bacterium]
MSKPTPTVVTTSSVKKRVALIMVLAIIAAAVAYPPPANAVIDFVNKTFGASIGHIEKGFVLGLDLQGGTRLEYEADVTKIGQSERSGAVDGVRDVIERRVNSLGVSEPLIQTARVGEDWRVSVELAGIRDVNEAIKLIGETPILEFKEQNTDQPRDLTAEEKKKMDADNAATVAKANAALAGILKDPNSLGTVASLSSNESVSKANNGDLGFIKDKPEYAALYDAVKNEKAGTIIPRLIDTSSASIIAKVEESKVASTEVKAAHILIQFAGAQNAPTSTTATKEQARAQIEKIRKEVTPKNFADLAKKYSQEPAAKESSGDLGYFGKGAMVPEFETAAFATKVGEISQVVETPFGFHIIYVEADRAINDVHVRAVYYKKVQASDILPAPSEWKATQLTGKQLKSARVEFDQRTGAAQVALQFDDEGSKLFAEITKKNLQKPVAIFLDGQAISIPTVQSEITGGQAVISGNFSIDEAKVLAQRLQAGALPVPIKLIAQQSVGPTLGQDSVDKSLRAGMFGFLFVALFMLFWYRVPGFFAILSLGLYVGISFMVFKLLPVTMTLSGIAGFILSLGIAVDANVLVFERLKEELRSGKSYRTALEEAFKRAWPSIRDGNATTLISCAVLYWFSSSIIKGFALTLAIGIVMSLFTAIVVTRNVLRLVATSRIQEKAPWLFLDSSSKK